MRALGALSLSFVLVGCATAPPPPACPAGQEYRHTAQLFFGRNVGDKAGVSEADFRRFVDEELTPRFPDGLTVLDGGGQRRGGEDRRIRGAAPGGLVVLASGRGGPSRIEGARSASKARFRPGAALLVTPAACGPL